MKSSISTYFTRVLSDKRVGVLHIGTYLTLVLLWHRNNEQSPVRISRKQIMGLARIKSISTYHKYIQDLEKFGYIKYVPTYDSRTGTQVWLT